MPNAKFLVLRVRLRNLILLLVSFIILAVSSVTLFLFVITQPQFGLDPERGALSSIFMIFFMIISVLLFFTSFLTVMTFQEYKNYYLQIKSETKRKDRLSLHDVFKNKNRKKILMEILNEQGIHYNELLRRTNLSPGQLQWHLNVLLEFEIIQKQKVAHYLVFFTYLTDESEKKEHMLSIKSKSALRILSLI
ncbi:MAG: winged helix-turn-helix transcriptional regulator, partial [Candidatus Hodarchaeota archaeon]